MNLQESDNGKLKSHKLWVTENNRNILTRWMSVSTYKNNSYFMGQQPLVGQGPLIIEASQSHSDTPSSVGFLWTSDQLDAENSIWQHTALSRERRPCPRARFVTAMPAWERPQTYAIDRAATRIGGILPCAVNRRNSSMCS
jgi:hypothetical protein